MSKKPEWAKKATELFPATDLAREVKQARTADLGGAVARQAEAFLTRYRAEQERKHQRTWWQREDCPEWCDRTHQDADTPANRFHEVCSFRAALSLELTLVNPANETARTDYRKAGNPAYAGVSIRQDMGGRRAQVRLQIGSGAFWDVHNLTAGEAYALGEALQQAAIRAEKITDEQ